MKKAFLLIIVLYSTMGFSQTEKELNDLQNMEEIQVELLQPNSFVAIFFNKLDPKNTQTLLLKTRIKACNEAQGMVLKLANGETLSFKNAKLLCTEKTNAFYELIGSLPITPSLYEKLAHQEIIEFTLGTTSVPVVYKEKLENLNALFHFFDNH